MSLSCKLRLRYARYGSQFASCAVLTLVMGQSVSAQSAARSLPPAHAQENGGAAISTRVDVQPGELLAAAPSANWLMYHGDYSGRRYSALDQINTGNVAQLRAQWVFHAPGSGEWEVTPVVVDGIMFVGAANDAYAPSRGLPYHITNP